jgi:hypothetical protein
MKKITLILIVLFTQFAFSQVGVNTTTPDPSSMLDISAANKGVLVPRVSLNNVTTTQLDGTNTAATGLLIWNTNATTTGGNGVGFYFFNGTQWMPVLQTITDDQTIDNFSLNGTILRLSLEDDGQPLQTVNLASINTDDQNLTTPTLVGTTLSLGIENGTGTSINLAALQDGDTQNTLDQAYDEGGPGAGRIITASNGAVLINGNDGFQNTGTFGSGATLALTGADTKMFFYPRKAAFRAGYVNGTQWNDANIGNYSIALGSSPIASNSFAVALGRDATATGASSVSLGWNGTASGASSIAMNYLANASGDYSSSIGRESIASGEFATSIGYSANASNQNSVAIGNSTISSGIGSVAIGQSTSSSGLRSFATGYANNALGDYSTSMGRNTFAHSAYETVIGLYSTIYTPNSATAFNPADRLFVVGNGSSATRSNALTIYKNGLMNINDEYNMPLVDGVSGQVMTTDGAGNVTFQNPNIGTDNQNIQNLAFNATTNVLTVGIENGTSQTVSLAALATGGDITGVNAGAGLTGGGTTGTVTVTAAANNGLNVDAVADNIQLGGPLVENTTIAQGIYSLDINLDNTGDFSIQDNGTDVFFVEDTGDIGIGTSNPAYPLHIVENVAATTYGVYIDKADNSTSQTSGLYIQKTGTGTGRSHAILTNIDGAGIGQKYGIFNNINSNADGNQYGTRNFINGATSSFIFGTFNNLDNAGTGNQYGVYNGMRGVAAVNLYGTYNEFNSPTVANETAGVFNSFSLGTPGTNGMMGVYTDFSNPSNGTYYGVRNAYTTAATGTGIKYGTYNLIPTAAGGTHYGTFNSVSVANGWAGYFVGRNYISDRLSIGVIDNPNAALNINKNSTGTYAHIELTESQANDGSRIRFNNSVETDTSWIIYGRADDTAADSQFNIFNSVAGDVVRVRGTGRVGIMRNPATNALEVEGNASKTVAGGFLANSDSRLKKDISTISPDEALEKILKLRGVTYHWNDDKTGTTRPENLQMGFIAQEIAEVFPEKVTEDNLGYLQTAYGDYDPIVFQAIKALNDKIENLEKENAALKSIVEKVNALEAKLEQMNIK